MSHCGLSVGIIGLPNVGKSTLFNALLKDLVAEVSNYPFCTIEPNVGIVEVPDSRLDELQKILKVPEKIPAPIKFVDIAGLVKNAHKGEGLGNQFLSHIQEVDAMVLVLRLFSDPKTALSQKETNPNDDFETIKTELILKDLEILEKILTNLKTDLKRGEKSAEEQIDILKKIKKTLNQSKLFDIDTLDNDKKNLISDFGLLTLKPILIILNCDEKDLKNPPFISQLPKERQIAISVKTEMELADFSDSEQEEYLKSLGLKEPGLNRLVQAGYQLLNLVSFYTFTENLAQAWPIPKNTPIQKAAGIVHSDFQEKFIKAEVVSYNDLTKYNGWHNAKEAGRIRTEGKEYIVKDGDVILVKHG